MARGQAVVFLVVAVIILIGVLMVVLIPPKRDHRVIPDVSMVQSSLKACVSKVGQDAVELAVWQGGFYDRFLTEPTILYGMAIPYYVDKNQLLIPTVKEVEGQVKRYVEDYVPSCVAKFKVDWNQQGISIEQGVPDADVSILADVVRIAVRFPVRVKKGSFETVLSEEGVVVKSRISDFLGIASRLSKEYRSHPNSICVTCLSDESDDETVIRVLKIGDMEGVNNAFLFTILDKSSPVGDTFRFVVDSPIGEVIP